MASQFHAVGLQGKGDDCCDSVQLPLLLVQLHILLIVNRKQNSIYCISNSDLMTPHHMLNITASLTLSANTNELLNVKNENLEKIYFVAWKSWTAVIPASIGDFGSLCKTGHHKSMPLMRPLLQCTIKLATVPQIAQSLIMLIWMKLKTSFCIMTQLMKLT